MKKYLIFIILFLLIASSSCKKDFLTSLATNPNAPSVTTANALLIGSLANTAAIMNSSLFQQYAYWVGHLSYSTGYQTSVPYELYGFTSSNFDVWTPLYLNVNNYNALLNLNTGPYYNAIAKIMMVYDFEALVDSYNNVPYFNALKGAGNLTPSYDNGSVIYDDLLKQLDASITTISGASASSPNPGTADIMYGGNMTNWLKFANTLKLRLALRQSNLSTKTAALKTDIQSTQSLGYLDGTNSAEVNPGYLNSDANGGQQSPLWLQYGLNASGGAIGSRANTQANSYAVNFFYNHNDTLRANQVYAVNPTNGLVVSTFFGERNPPKLTPSKFGPGVLKSPTMNAKLLSSAEALFLQSEAAAAGMITGNAGTLYNAGIKADFVDKGLTAAQATAYYSQVGNAFPTAGSFATQQQAIIGQKWAALIVYGSFEAFNELRRSGYPNDIPLSLALSPAPTKNISRIFYPFVEFSTNAANVAAQGTVDKFNSKIFWAK